MNTIRILFFIGVFLSLFSTAYTQEPMGSRTPATERIEQFKKLRLMEVLKMNEETSIKFFLRYNKQMESLREIGKKRNELINHLQSLSASNSENEEMDQCIKDILLIDEKIASEKTNFINEIKEILTLKQVADYIVFERNFTKNLRELVRETAKERFERNK